MKSILRRLLPENILRFWHIAKAKYAAWKYNNPSSQMMIIGITGTKGKSTTANFVWSVLQMGGIKTGLIGTANIRMGDIESMNEYHMTMPSPMIVQKLFAQMKTAGCKAVVMEVTSEGIKQYRHLGIHFSFGMFTNLSPEHLPSHNNSYEEYARTKAIFFENLGENTTAIFNADDQKALYFSDFYTGKKIFTSFQKNGTCNADLTEISALSTKFSVEENEYTILVGGNKNAENALLAVSLAKELNISEENIKKGLLSLSVIPGRMEKIDEGQNFTVFVDYAHEEKSMQFIVETGNAAKKDKKLIVLLGAEGGGRDPRKRAIMGQIVGKEADFVVVSNVDPYEDDPTPICEDIAVACEAAGKQRGENLFVIEDRKSGIQKALSLASEGDIVFITGKGSEQTIVIGGKVFPWDDRDIVRSLLH